MDLPPDRFIAGCVEITLHATQEGSDRVNVFHYDFGAGASPPTATDLASLAQSFWNQISASYKALTSTSVNFGYVTARDISAAGRNIGTFTPAQPQPGSGTGDFTPGNAATVISHRTGVAARYGRGRTFIFGLPEGVTVGSTINSTQLAAIATLGALIKNFIGASSPMTVSFAVASFAHELLLPVISQIVDIYIDSQRRRLINRGR